MQRLVRPRARVFRTANVAVKTVARRARRTTDVLQQFLSVLVKSANRPLFMLTFLLCAVIFLSDSTDVDKGPFAPLLPANSTNPVVVWIRANYPKFVGSLAFVPVLLDSPVHLRVPVAFAVFGWIYIVPERKAFEYLLQALLLHLYLHVPTAFAKLTLILIAAASFYFFGYLPA